MVPQRVKQADGSWADIDLNLGKDGTGWRPRMSTVDVAFSPGGDAPLVSVFKSGKRFTLSWPDSLPAPTVSGDAATYRDVYDDVDLVVRATEARAGE
jgi:hypothetical protein